MLVLVVEAGDEFRGARIELLGGEHARLQQEALEGGQPALVVARAVPVLLGGGDLGGEPIAEGVPGVALAVAHGDRHAEDAPLPRCLEHQLAVLARHRQVVAQVLDPLVAHRPSARSPAAAPLAAGAATFATPIIASRVTSAASSSSASPPVPAGRSGRTM